MTHKAEEDLENPFTGGYGYQAKLRGTSNCITLDSILTAPEKQEYVQRYKIRKIRIAQVAARYKIPMSELDDIVHQDFLTEPQIRRLLQKQQESPNDILEDVEKLVEPFENSGDVEMEERERKQAVLEQLERAKTKLCLTSLQAEQLTEIVMRYQQTVFRTKFGNDAAAKFEPLKIRLKEGAQPKRVKFFNLSPKAKQALSETIEDLKKKGLIRENNKAHWISNMMIIPKPKNNPQDPNEEIKFRCVLDLRYINSQTVPIMYPTTDLEEALAKCKGAQYFIGLDLLKGFWQCAIDEDSQEYFSFGTPTTVYSYTRLPMGATDSAIWFNQQVKLAFQDLIDQGKVIVYIDDILGFAATYEEYLQLLDQILARCQEYRILVSIKKCTLGDHKIHFCGRDIDAHGFKFNPRSSGTIKDMKEPTTAGQLDQFLCALNYCRSALPRFAEISAPLKDLMEQIKKLIGSREKRKFQRIQLKDMGWNIIHQQSFQACKDSFEQALKLAHFNPCAQTCMFTDASGGFWSAILTQVTHWDDTKAIQDQDHQPIAVLSGEFNTTQINWSTIEKESYPIIHALLHWEHILGASTGLNIYTDHSNIVAMFRPETINPTLAKSAIDKVYRWLSVLSFFPIKRITHIRGEDNCMADMLSRWAHNNYEQTPTVQIKNTTYKGRTFSQMAPNFELPTIDAIAKAQQQPGAWSEQDTNFLRNDKYKQDIDIYEDTIRYQKRPFIPENSDLRIRVMTIAHSGCSGHRSQEHMIKKIREHVYWPSIKTDVIQYTQACLNCLKVKGGKMMPRPFGERTFPTKRNQIISLDYMFIEHLRKESPHCYIYVLVIKDEYSGFIDLTPCEAANHEEAVNALAYWCSRFGIPEMIQTDGGTHFVNNIIQLLCKRLGISHHITTPYCPFSNGSVERVNREIKKFLMLALQEQHLPNQQWPYLLPFVMSIINNHPAARLNNNSPRQVLTGLPNTDPFTCIYTPDTHTMRTIPWQSNAIQLQLKELLESLQDMHHMVDNAKKNIRDKRNHAYIRHHLQGTRRYKNAYYSEDRIIPDELEYADRYDLNEAIKLDANFAIGDLVLVAIPENKHLSKLQCRWQGPYQVVNMILPRLALVKHLVTGKERQSHVAYMKFYEDKSLGISQEILDDLLMEASRDQDYIIERIVTHSYDHESKSYRVLIKWKGLSDIHNTLEPLLDIQTIDPDKVNTYLQSLPIPVRETLKAYIVGQVTADALTLQILQSNDQPISSKLQYNTPVMIRNTYWKTRGRRPRYYAGVINDTKPIIDKSKGLLWPVKFTDGVFNIPACELATNMTELCAIENRYNQLANWLPQ